MMPKMQIETFFFWLTRYVFSPEILPPPTVLAKTIQRRPTLMKWVMKNVLLMILLVAVVVVAVVVAAAVNVVVILITIVRTISRSLRTSYWIAKIISLPLLEKGTTPLLTPPHPSHFWLLSSYGHEYWYRSCFSNDPSLNYRFLFPNG